MTQLTLDTGVPVGPPHHPIGERWESTDKFTAGSVLEVISEPTWRPCDQHGYWVWTLRGLKVLNEPFEIELADAGIRKNARRTTRPVAAWAAPR